jgi:hypothetical protein
MQYFCEIFSAKGLKTPKELSWLSNAMKMKDTPGSGKGLA